MRRCIKTLILLVALFLISCSNESRESLGIDKSNLQYKRINFGKQNDVPVSWYIISDDVTHQILLSEKVLDVKLYNATNEKLAWEDTTLYDYLNSDFINEYFSKEEREKITFVNNDATIVTLPTSDNLIDLCGTINYLKDGFYGDKNFFYPNDKLLAYPAKNAINNDIDPFDNKTFSEYLRTEVDPRYEFANGAVPYWLLNKNGEGLPLYVTSTGYISWTEPNTGYIGIRPIIRLKK